MEFLFFSYKRLCTEAFGIRMHLKNDIVVYNVFRLVSAHDNLQKGVFHPAGVRARTQQQNGLAKGD